ncbi:MAG: hypothetical protein JWL61_1529 [Gemmatimonadetes bacterium]|nr:hypothetical protein [Gemmatimonadota bacterium]
MSEAGAAAREVLVGALSSHVAAASGPTPDLLTQLLIRLRKPAGDDDSLVHSLVAFAGVDDDRRAELTNIVGVAARELAPDDVPPVRGAAAEAWRALVVTADRLHGSGAYALGRPAFVTDRLLGLLVEESRAERPSDLGGRRATSAPGDVLAALAVSRQLATAMNDALPFKVVPTYDALYEYDPPGGRVRTHVDSRDFEIVFHLLLEQPSPAGEEAKSVLVVHRPLESEPSRLRLRVGEAVVLRGRGTIHSWEPLGREETRTLVAVGFTRKT